MFRTSSVHHQERFTSCIRRLWYVVIRVLLDTSSRYEVVGKISNFVRLFHLFVVQLTARSVGLFESTVTVTMFVTKYNVLE